MSLRTTLIRNLRPFLGRHPRLEGWARRADTRAAVLRHRLARRFPGLIRPEPHQLTVAITAACNARCLGCRYGRDFMVGEQLSLETVKGVVSDARGAGVHRVRFFGGEPLLHPDLPEMIAHARGEGLDPYITTNGTLLERRIDELYEVGLRWMTMGFYGVGEDYDGYTGREGLFARLERGIARTRKRYGDRFEIQINFLLSARSCSLEALRRAWEFAQRYDLFLSVDPVSDTIPFFADPGGVLRVDPGREAELQRVVDELVRLRRAHPERMPQAVETLRALPDVLLRPEGLDLPCDAYELLWVGADGTVQLCDVHFVLGNVHERPLREMLFGKEHRKAARDGFRLRCPRCMCKYDSRIRKDAASLKRYGCG